MKDESQNASIETCVLAYATPGAATTWKPPPVWIRWAVAALSMFTLGMFLLGLPPLSGAADYTRVMPMSEIVECALETGVRGTLDSGEMIRMACFVPIALAGLVAFSISRGTVSQCIALGGNIALPILWLGPLWFAGGMLIGPLVLLTALAGQCDGETRSAGIVCYAAIGTWSTLWIAGAIAVTAARLLKSRSVRL